jgi:hypothetical protein
MATRRRPKAGGVRWPVAIDRSAIRASHELLLAHMLKKGGEQFVNLSHAFVRADEIDYNIQVNREAHEILHVDKSLGGLVRPHLAVRTPWALMWAPPPAVRGPIRAPLRLRVRPLHLRVSVSAAQRAFVMSATFHRGCDMPALH